MDLHFRFSLFNYLYLGLIRQIYFLQNDEKNVSFKISSSDNSIGSVRNFESLDEFMIFFNDFIAERIDLKNIPVQIGTHRLAALLSVKDFLMIN